MTTILSIDHNQAVGTQATMRASDNSTKASGGAILTGFGDDWQQHYYQCPSSIVSDSTLLGLDRALSSLTPATSANISGNHRSENVPVNLSLTNNTERWIVFEYRAPQVGANPGHQGPFQMKTSGAPDAGSPVMGISMDASTMYLTDASNDEKHSLGAPPRTSWSVFAIGMYVTTSTANAWVKCYRRDTGQSQATVVMAKETWNSRRTTTGGSSLTNNVVTGTMFPEGSSNYLKFGNYRTSTTASAYESRYGKIRVFSTESEAVTFMNSGTGGGTTSNPPTGDFTWSPANPTTGSVTTFTANITPASGQTISNYAWTSDNIAFGSNSNVASITYQNAGTKNVALVVTQSDNQQLQVNHQITAAQPTSTPLSTSFTFTPTAPVTQSPVSFAATATGGKAPYTYSWSLDGLTTLTGQNPSFSFQNPGTKNVTLTTTDANNATATSTSQVVVAAAQPTGGGIDAGPTGDLYWKGLNWTKRTGPSGSPGVGTWAAANISGPDANGWLTFHMANQIGCELDSTRSGFGYGTYTITTNANFTAMAPNAVWGGLFTYDNTMASNTGHNEIDVCETSAWGGSTVRVDNTYFNSTNTQSGKGVAVYPSGQTQSSAAPGAVDNTYQMIWESGKITWKWFVGADATGTLKQTAVATTNIPVPNKESICINLWPFGANAGTVDVVVKNFSFVPAGTSNPNPPSTPSAPRMSVAAKGLVNGTTYQVRVRSKGYGNVILATSEVAAATPAALAVPVTDSYKYAVLGLTGLSSYWPLGDAVGSTSAADILSTKAGTPTNVTFGSTRLIASDPNTSGDFAAGQISLGDYLDLAARSPFFLLATFQTDAISATYMSLVSKISTDSTGQTQGYRMGFDNSGITVERFVDNVSVKATGAVPVIGTIYRVIGVYDGSQMIIYVNGTKTVGAADARSLKDTTSPLIFGSNFDGRMAHVAIGTQTINDTIAAKLEQTATSYDDALPATLPAPSGVVDSTNSVKLSWTASADNGHAYYVIEKLVSGTWSRIGITASTQWNDPNQVGGSTQTYRARDVDLFGNFSAPSQTTAIAIPNVSNPGGSPPAPVTGLRAYPGDTQVMLDWDDSTDPELAGYKVYQQTSALTWPAAANYSPVQSTRTITGLVNGSTYRWRVTVVRNDGTESDFVEVASVPQAPAPAVGNIQVNNGKLVVTAQNTESFLIPKTIGSFANVDVYLTHGNTSTQVNTDLTGIVLKQLADASSLVAYISSTTLYVGTFSKTGGWSVVSSVALPTAQLSSVSYWLRANITDNQVTVQHWLKDPQTANAGDTPAQTLTANLSGADATKFGAGIVGKPGIYIKAVSASWATLWIDNFEVLTGVGAEQSVTVRNKGNFRTQPLISLVGPMTGVEIVNVTNGQVMRLNSNLVDGEQMFIDVAAKTIKGADGENKFKELDLASDWIELEPGENVVKLNTTSAGSKSGVIVSFRNTWI